MINPSANGWIDKFFAENNDNFIDFQGNILSFYEDCRATGFIYGYVVRYQLQNQINNVSVPTFKYNLTASSDLNSITTSGLHSAAAGIPKLVKNYPTTGAGTLTQNVIGTLKTQQYISITGLMFVRGYNGTAWSTWRSI